MAAAPPEDLADVLAQAILPGERRYTAEDVAREAGLDRTVSRRFWRALGFPDPAPDERIFTRTDVVALQEAVAPLHTEADIDQAVAQARAVAAGMAIIAETWTDAVVPQLRELAERGASGEELARAVLASVDLPRVGPLLDYTHRVQLLAALRRRLAWGGPSDAGRRLVVGFADLVGYTALTQQLTAAQLERLIAHFEADARDAIASSGGRVVKSLGDAVLLAAPDEATGLRVGLHLAETLAADPELPPARVALDVGPVVQREGDVFGAAVNRANRIVQVAPAGTVVVSRDLRDAIAGSGVEVHLELLGPRSLKDVGPTELWVVTR